MLIVGQDGKTVVVLETIGQMYCDSTYDNFTRIYVDFADGRSCCLGKYHNEGFAEKVIEKIIDTFENIMRIKFFGCENECYVSHTFRMPKQIY